MTTYLNLTANALTESIIIQANSFAEPTIKIQVLELCSEKEKISAFIDTALKYYQKLHPNKKEEFICLNLLSDLEHNFEDSPITEDENYIPSPLYKYLMLDTFRKTNFAQDIYNYNKSDNFKYNKTLTCQAKSFLELLEICENNSISKLYSKDISIARIGAEEIEMLALIRQEHTQHAENLLKNLLKKVGFCKKNSLDMISEKRYKSIIESN